MDILIAGYSWLLVAGFVGLVAKVARGRDYGNWFVLAIFLGPLALIGLVLAGDLPSDTAAPANRLSGGGYEPIDEHDQRQCRSCGTKFVMRVKVCSSCGYDNDQPISPPKVL
jgi:hypothetical protein